MWESVKPLGAGWEGWKPESGSHPGSRKTEGADELWMGSGGAAEAEDGTPATRASAGKASEFGEVNCMRVVVEARRSGSQVRGSRGNALLGVGKGRGRARDRGERAGARGHVDRWRRKVYDQARAGRTEVGAERGELPSGKGWWCGGTGRCTGSLWKAHAPSPKGGRQWRPEGSPWRVAGNLDDRCKVLEVAARLSHSEVCRSTVRM